MRQKLVAAALTCMIVLSIISIGKTETESKKIRVGVYDNRAIAMAYFGSEYNVFLKKRAEHHEALAAGDSTKAQELTEWVEKFQRQIHFQGFCRVPVDDLLLLVKEKIAKVAEANNIDLIGWYPDYTNADVEVIDITDELVALFNPSEDKLMQIEGLKGTEPLALADIDHEH